MYVMLGHKRVLTHHLGFSLSTWGDFNPENKTF